MESIIPYFRDNMSGKNIIIIGGGFGGLTLAKNLQHSDFNITLIDKTNHHVFQPLLYQVAMAALSPGDIAVPIRSVFRGIKRIEVLLENAQSVDKEMKRVYFTGNQDFIEYDFLILAVGSNHSYFGKNEWKEYAPGLKTLNDALHIRESIFTSLEMAEKLHNRIDIAKYLTFVIIGGGPTGVELSGALAEILLENVKKDYKFIEPQQINIYLIEGINKILPTFPYELSNKAQKDLEKLGVKVLLNTRVTNVSNEGVFLGDRFISSKNIIWAAGTEAQPLLKTLDVPLERSGRVIVENDLSIKDYPEIFVIGDAAAIKDAKGNYLPGVAQVAIQEGKYVAGKIMAYNSGNYSDKFTYKDRGTLATIGRAKAVALIKGHKFTGIFAWLLWVFVHILFLIGFRNKALVIIEWIWYYFSLKPGIRLIIQSNSE
jgi:NADH:ubiquinone reductase (H+-translocating)